MILFVENGLNIPLVKDQKAANAFSEEAKKLNARLKTFGENRKTEARPVVTKKADHVTWGALRKFVYDVLEKAGYKKTDVLAQSGLMRAEFEVKNFYKLVPEDIMYYAGGTLRAAFVESYFLKSYRESALKETSNLPAIAQVAGVLANPKITSVVRQDTIFNTVQAMGLPVKINAMKNVVAEVSDMPTAGTVLQKIYQQFGVKGSFMVTWDGKGKLYWDPKTPVDKPVALAYAKQANLPPPNFTKLLNSKNKVKESSEAVTKDEFLKLCKNLKLKTALYFPNTNANIELNNAVLSVSGGGYLDFRNSGSHVSINVRDIVNIEKESGRGDWGTYKDINIKLKNGNLRLEVA